MKKVGAVAITATMAVAVSLSTGCRKGNLYSPQDELKMGQQFTAEYDSKLPDGRLLTSGMQYDRLQRVASRMIPLARAEYDMPYTVKLVDSKEINAFAVPGGPIYFYRGLMELASSDDEVASVLGHELNHIVRRHSTNQMSKAMQNELGVTLAAAILGGNTGRTIDKMGQIVLPITQLRFSRNDENQADEHGFRYLVSAGYNPDAMASFFTKMGQKSGGGGIEFLQSHPLTQSRVDKAKQRAAAVKAGTYVAPKK